MEGVGRLVGPPHLFSKEAPNLDLLSNKDCFLLQLPTPSSPSSSLLPPSATLVPNLSPRHQPAVLGTAQHRQRRILYPVQGKESRREEGPVTTFLNWRPGLTELGSAREQLTETGTEGEMCHQDGILGALLTLPGNHLA